MGFNTANAQVWQAIQRLNAPEMRHLLQFLKTESEHTKTSLISAEGNHLLRLQGRAGFLEELLEAVATADSVLEKMR